MVGPQEHSWAKAHRLAKELSETLVELGAGDHYARILSGGQAWPIAFGNVGDVVATEHPQAKVDRQAAALADALNECQGGRFHCRIYPSKVSGRSIFFVNTAASERIRA